MHNNNNNNNSCAAINKNQLITLFKSQMHLFVSCSPFSLSIFFLSFSVWAPFGTVLICTRFMAAECRFDLLMNLYSFIARFEVVDCRRYMALLQLHLQCSFLCRLCSFVETCGLYYSWSKLERCYKWYYRYQYCYNLYCFSILIIKTFNIDRQYSRNTIFSTVFMFYLQILALTLRSHN